MGILTARKTESVTCIEIQSQLTEGMLLVQDQVRSLAQCLRLDLQPRVRRGLPPIHGLTAVNLGIYRRFQEEGISLAYPTQNLIVRSRLTNVQ